MCANICAACDCHITLWDAILPSEELNLRWGTRLQLVDCGGGGGGGGGGGARVDVLLTNASDVPHDRMAMCDLHVT